MMTRLRACMRRESPTPSPPPPPGSQGSPTPTPARDARLSAIRLMAGDAGTPVTLSTAFQPTVTSYGAVVAHNTSDVTLCLQVPSNGESFNIPAASSIHVLLGASTSAVASLLLMLSRFQAQMQQWSLMCWNLT